MKSFPTSKIITLLISLLLLFAILSDTRTNLAKANPTTWIVDDDEPADFDRIQNAIDAAKSGDIIYVRRGTYFERINIHKSITLQGEEMDSTIIDGNGTGNVISITASNVCVKGFTVRGSGKYYYSGIFIQPASQGNVISNNKLIDNYHGIYVSSSNNQICDNIITSNYYGIHLYSFGNNTISRNTIALNVNIGIFLASSLNNKISRNFISQNILGVHLYYSRDNKFYGNNISNNYCGAYLDSLSSNNIFYYNNFNDNTNHSWSDAANFWSLNGEGNYWDDYVGQDLNMDGIGDDPYIINEINRDYNPFMGAFSDFDASFEGNTYSIKIVSNSTISDFKFGVGEETGNKIIAFNVSNRYGSAGFCRIMIPTGLMKPPYDVLLDGVKIVPKNLTASIEGDVCLYFAYQTNHTVRIISSEMFQLYYELLNRYFELRENFISLNNTFKSLFDDYAALLNDYNSLVQNFNMLNESYQEHLSEYAQQVQNYRSLLYILCAIVGTFIIITVYLSKQASQASGAHTKLLGKG
ncbi:MAG: NosD domain-containing protein [Candidatus Bathyarchaeia archaeon]